MAGEKFKINFISDGFGEVYIDEPIGFSSISFDVMQKERGYGRDIFFNGGEMQMEFTDFRNHYIDKLLYYFHFYGFEAKAQLITEFKSGESVTMDLDFKSAITDDLTYFKCKCIEVSEVQIVKRRRSVKVDLFSDKDIDGNPITPVTTHNILLKPKEVWQKSVWEQTAFNNVRFAASGAGTETELERVNPCVNIVQSEINDTLSFFETQESPNTLAILAGVDDSNMYIMEAANSMTNIRLAIENTNIHLECDSDGGANGYSKMNLKVRYGADFNSAKELILLSVHIDEEQTYDYDSETQGDFIINIPSLNRGDRIWVYFRFEIRKSNSGGGAIECFATITGMKTTLMVLSKSYYSTTKGIRLIDAVKQVVKSISGLNINAPILDIGSLYYDTMVFNGNLLRGIVDKPFYLSLEDIEQSLTEGNIDNEIGETVFFGNERDFYTNNEIWFFDNTQFSAFTKKVNDRFAINEFTLMYKNYQSKKENEITNSSDTIHGEIKMTLFSKMVENKAERSIEYIRDSFLIEEAKEKSLTINKETSSQDDDKIFAIDIIENTEDTVFKETTKLYHEYNTTTGKLILRTKDEPNFLALGINEGSSFKIGTPDYNAGYYTVYKVEQNTLELTKTTANPNANNNGERLTTYLYTISNEDYPFINRTNEEISNVINLNSPETYSNMRFSIRRNIENNYPEYLSTCNLYWKDKPIIKTWYKNNPECSFMYNGLTTIEGGDYLPNNPILSPWIYENAIFANVDLEDFILIRNSLKSDRGFIRCIDKVGNPLKLYPTKMSYENLRKELNITGEAKYEPTIMLIENTSGFIVINNEITVNSIDWEIIDHKLSIFDSNRFRLFNPVFWNNVSINGGFAENEEELTELLNLL